MTIRPIRMFGDPVLRTPAAVVTRFDDALGVLVQDLVDTMLDAPGAGLAAPQIGIGKRVFTYHVDGVLGHVVNPELVLSQDSQVGLEGCLSIPDLRYDVTRAMSVEVRGWDQHGEALVLAGSGLFARACQHETDHLDGVLFLDRLDRETRRLAMRALRGAEPVAATVVGRRS
ncbi:MAG: peptide deformylase [Actinomycetota bacterium]|nr:peptide deformylase [Actinomycetota bacterium]MDQ3629268.1 peptide deformylase [Actinomycetota bacterium]